MVSETKPSPTIRSTNCSSRSKKPSTSKQPDRFGVQAELRPGGDLRQLLKRSEATGKGGEAVGEVGHQRLALVHGVGDVQLGEPGMGQLPVDELLGDHSDDPSPGRQGGVGDGSHQTD